MSLRACQLRNVDGIAGSGSIDPTCRVCADAKPSSVTSPEDTILTVNAIAAPSATEPLARTTIERRELGPSDVLIEIRYAGICHSDIHTVRGEWGSVPYPLTVGHEIVGQVTEVTEVGAEVTRHAVGDRVGVGCMVNSCRECDNCRAGRLIIAASATGVLGAGLTAVLRDYSLLLATALTATAFAAALYPQAFAYAREVLERVEQSRAAMGISSLRTVSHWHG